jgi:hypothetical protein
MKFTIRDLLWLTVVVALGVAWYVDHRRADVLADKVKVLRESLMGVFTLYRDEKFGPEHHMSMSLEDGEIIRARESRNSSGPAPNLPSD